MHMSQTRLILGAEISITTKKSRKTFHLTKPLDLEDQTPLAIESFAVDPNFIINGWMQLRNTARSKISFFQEVSGELS